MSESESTLRQMGKAIGVGSGMALSVVGGGFVGYKLGQTVGLEIVGLILGIILGLAVALRSIMKTFSNNE